MAYSVDFPDAEFHEILPNLYLGGHIWREGLRVKDGRSSSVSEDQSWDYVVSAYVDFDTCSEKTLPQCDMRLVLFDDTEQGLDEATWQKIRSVVDEVASRWSRNQKILIRCQAGYNRSGMLMSLVLMRLGYTADGAIELLRKHRGRHVLVNKVFERYVREREGEYRDSESVNEGIARRIIDFVFSDDEGADTVS